ncbi:MAG TPA: hypothetical protein ENN73_00710, partial [Firmicutes bacterium]|nr:hypothetical protein [Bacillota bacterium]
MIQMMKNRALKNRENEFMKNLFSFFLLVLMFSITASEEIYAEPFFRDYGITFGLVSSNIESDFFINHRSKNGVSLSLSAESKKIMFFYISAEVNYIQKGILDTYILFNPMTYEILGMEELKHRLDYISIPVHIKIYRENDFISPYILFGPRFDYLFNYRSDVYD